MVSFHVPPPNLSILHGLASGGRGPPGAIKDVSCLNGLPGMLQIVPLGTWEAYSIHTLPFDKVVSDRVGTSKWQGQESLAKKKNWKKRHLHRPQQVNLLAPGLPKVKRSCKCSMVAPPCKTPMSPCLISLPPTHTPCLSHCVLRYTSLLLSVYLPRPIFVPGNAVTKCFIPSYKGNSKNNNNTFLYVCFKILKPSSSTCHQVSFGLF